MDREAEIDSLQSKLSTVSNLREREKIISKLNALCEPEYRREMRLAFANLGSELNKVLRLNVILNWINSKLKL
jgi:hypothetical protein